MTLVLVVILFVPLVAWLIVRWLPAQRERDDEKANASGVKHRWWQP